MLVRKDAIRLQFKPKSIDRRYLYGNASTFFHFLFLLYSYFHYMCLGRKIRRQGLQCKHQYCS
ncbi:wsv488 [White spot syndrome virus]|uniref:Wsv488 n=3 Tax=White spot syndrome virus TaxID=342409 RepID=Q8VAD7_WSSVS|nr:wsv488 [Shrimp white spot syndrome virus]AAL33489.1 wsv488 [Shrimp white spot syndrome virus]AAL88883.1 WSSV015 [Shrimp white spot syndrome virus]AFX59861.1 wsv488 [White spot syndrome virus]AWQ62711.1 wsv488 [Shrimp white spot syndrome virus]